MKIIDATGGARVGSKNVSWPFARIVVRKKELILTVKAIGEYTFSPEEIEYLEILKIVPGLGRGVRIHHSKDEYPEKIIFWTLSKPKYIVKTIEKSDFWSKKFK